MLPLRMIAWGLIFLVSLFGVKSCGSLTLDYTDMYNAGNYIAPFAPVLGFIFWVVTGLLSVSTLIKDYKALEVSKND